MKLAVIGLGYVGISSAIGFVNVLQGRNIVFVRIDESNMYYVE